MRFLYGVCVTRNRKPQILLLLALVPWQMWFFLPNSVSNTTVTTSYMSGCCLPCLHIVQCTVNAACWNIHTYVCMYLGLGYYFVFWVPQESRLFWKVQKVPKVHNSFAFQGQTKISRRSYWFLWGTAFCCQAFLTPIQYYITTSPYYIVHIDYRIDVLLLCSMFFWKLLLQYKNPVKMRM